MDVSPQLEQGFRAAASVCCSSACINNIWKRMRESIRLSDEALRYAHDAWDQLEPLNSNMLSIYGLVDPPGTEDLTAAFKEAKLLTRDRVVWQTMGRFRDVMDMMQSIEYISEIVKGDQTRISQLRHAFLKIHSDMLVQLIGRSDCWQPFALNLGHNRGDFNVELLLSQIDQFKQVGLLMDTDNDHLSIMQLPVIIQQAMRNTKSIIHTAHELNDGRIGASSDMARCLDSLNHLSRDLAHQHFGDPVLQKLTSSMHASLLAVQQAVGAWAHLHSISWKGLMLAKHAEDGARKLRKLVNLVEKEIILAACAYLGTSGLADFGFIEHVVRHEVSFRGMPRVPMGEFLWSLRSTHASMQKELLHELILSEKTWAQFVQKIWKAMHPDN